MKMKVFFYNNSHREASFSLWNLITRINEMMFISTIFVIYCETFAFKNRIQFSNRKFS